MKVVPGYDETAESASPVEFDGLAADYDRLLDDPLRNVFSSGTDFFHRRKFEVIRNSLAAMRLDSRTLAWLDVGCGRGELLNLAGSCFRSAEGCEPSKEMIRHSRGGIYWQPDLNRLPFADSSYDFITAVCVFHHVPDACRIGLAAEIRRVLRPDGIFCMFEHNPFNPITRWIVSHTPIDHDAHLLSCRVAARILGVAGFEPIRKTYFLYAPKRIYDRFNWIENLLAQVPAGGQYAIFGRKSAVKEAHG